MEESAGQHSTHRSTHIYCDDYAYLSNSVLCCISHYAVAIIASSDIKITSETLFTNFFGVERNCFVLCLVYIIKI